MSEYYTPKRTSNLYEHSSSTPFKLCRSKIELFIQCPKGFYLDQRLGVSRPLSYPYTLNSAVDALLKKEFDLLRENSKAHPLMEKHNIDAVPVKTGYFVYCNGRTDMDKFDGRFEFDITLIPYEGNDNWVEGTVIEMHKCLNSNIVPEPGEGCDFCAYRDAVQEVQNKT